MIAKRHLIKFQKEKVMGNIIEYSYGFAMVHVLTNTGIAQELTIIGVLCFTSGS